MTTFRRFFSLASAAALAAALLAAPASRAAEPLLLQWGAIDTDAPAAQAESAALKAKVAKKAAAARKAGATAETRAAYLVQFPAAVSEAQRSWLEASTQVRGYIPENAYIVWATPSEMDDIASSPDVSWTGEWKKEYKTVRTAAAKRAADGEARWMQVGSLLEGDDGAADLRARLEALPATVRSAFPRFDGVSAVAFLTDAQIDEVASWPDVDWIEPKLQPILLNDKAVLTNMMNVTPAWKAVSAGGLGLTGAGQVVAVADTGCDKGSTSDIHADFASRVKAGYGWVSPNPDEYEGGVYDPSYSWADTDAHGTHVCGSILGSGAQSSGQFRGVAYEAQLVMQGCQADLTGLPDNAQDLFKQAYSQGARIHSDSWGFGTNLAAQYVYDAVYADGYMWTNQNFLALFAAGNDGIDKNRDGVIDPGSVTPPSTSKNCLCVGAAENYRSSGGYSTTTWGDAWGSDYPTAPIKGDKISGTTTPQGMAAFSSRGPTADGRIKPDIVAPGTDIISVRSRSATDTGWGTYNTHYLYEGGTSMATPLTSGATTLVRQWLVDRQGIAEPMAALMKALLINGARDMTPGQYGTGSTQEITARPDRSQGFGHVNLYNALEPGDGNFLVFATNKFTATGANFTTNIAVGQANAGKYVLTLAWQDYPGTSGSSKTLVNDLDLTVTSPSGTVYYPNNYNTLDHTNNVEFIEFTASEVGSYTVKVNAYKISKTTGVGSQPFALVMRGPETVLEPASPEFTSATSATEGVQYGDIEFTFSDILSAGYPAPAYSIATAVSTNEYEFDADTGYLYFQPADAGTFTFTCVASNEHGAATNTLTVTVTLAQPPTPPEPTVVASDSFTAIWTAVSGATGYELVVFEGAPGGSGGGNTYTLVTSADGLVAGDYLILADGTDCAMNNSCSGSTSGYLSPTDVTVDGTTVSNEDASLVWTLAGTADSCTLFNADAGKYVNPSTSKTIGWSDTASGAWTLSMNGNLVTAANAANTSWKLQYNSGSPRFTCYDSNQKKLRFFSRGASHSLLRAAGDVVFSNSVGNVTSYQVTGLQPDTTYSYSYRAIVDGEATPWSESTAVTTSEGDAAPVWSATFPSSVSTNVGDFYTLENVSSYVSGSPTPTITLDAPAGLEAELASDTFTFAAEAVGTYTFTFTASNSEGSATATLTVTVSAAPVTVPTLLVGDETATSAYATWDACTGVTSYTLQLASDDQFSTGGSGGTGGTLTETFANASFTTTSSSYTDQTISGGDLGTWTATSCRGDSTSPIIRYAGTLTSPTIAAGVASVEFDYDWPYTESGSCDIELYVGGTSQGTATVTGGTSGTATYTLASPVSGPTTIELLNKASSTKRMRVTEVRIGTPSSGASGEGSLILEETVSDTEYTFTGLTPETTYYARVKGDSDWSNVAEFTTESAGDSAPVWSALPANASAYVGEIYDITLTDYVTASPAATITLVSATADGAAYSAYQYENDYLVFSPDALVDYVFTFSADNGVGSAATASLTVTGVAEAATLSIPSSTVSATVGEMCTFEATFGGRPTPTLSLTSDYPDSVLYSISTNGVFEFIPAVTGEYTFTLTASNIAATVSRQFTVTVSAAPVTVPTLTVTNITSTTALATWTACDGVSSYTLQLSTNDFPAASGASRSATPILFEDFEAFNPAGGSSDISANLNQYTTNSGWTGSKVYTDGGKAKVGASSAQGWIMTPELTASGSLVVVWSGAHYVSSTEQTTLLLGVSEDGTNFDETTITLTDAMTGYTNTFTVTGPTVYVRWKGKTTSKARFYLDDVTITNPGGGDTPAGDDVQEFTVPGTSHEFTGLTPYTVYYARVKGNAGWSDTEEFITEEAPAPGIAPAWSAIPAQSVTVGQDCDLDLAPYVSGTDPITLSMAATEYDAVLVGTEFSFTPDTDGSFTFTFTAANDFGSADATLTVTATGTAPTLAAIADQTVAIEAEDITIPLTVGGNPAPTVSVTSPDAPEGLFEINSDGDFYFIFTEAGTFHFTVTAANGVSPDATTSFAVTVTGSPAPAEPLELDFSGQSILVKGTTAGQSYQLFWTSDLRDGFDPGATREASGDTVTFEFPSDGTWFGYVSPASSP